MKDYRRRYERDDGRMVMDPVMVTTTTVIEAVGATTTTTTNIFATNGEKR